MSTPTQYAALAAFESEALAVLEQRKKEYAQRRNYLLKELRAIGFGIEAEPVGAFYIYANIRGLTQLDSKDFCLQLLEEHGIAITPGADFGSHLASEHVRFAFTTSLEKLQEAVRRLREMFC
jgi:aspartate/methionine/tyrosine aminotransferase